MNKFFDHKSMYSGLHQLDFKFKQNDKILDIGGGNKPFPPSTHIIDFNDSEAEKQRHHKPLEIGDRIFLEGDAAAVLEGYDDNYFDFCYSSHTFEHVHNLPQLVDMINKKCKRGFYALPASDFEFFTTQPHFGHVNLCRLLGDTLHITKRNPDSVIKEFAKVYEKLHAIPQFNYLWEIKYRFLWEARLYWEGEIKYKFYENSHDLYPQLKYFEEEQV
jgi:ubiquinone/menaquinone biosynthesis C-methylase UbiE